MFGLLKRLGSIFLFEIADPPGGGTTGTDPGGAADPADLKAGKDTKDKKPAPVISWTAEQQTEIDRIMGLTREQERKKAKADFDADVAKAKKDAEDKELAEKQEFKTLAENRLAEIETLKGEITTLTDAKEQGEKYKAALEASLKAQTEKLPAHIKTLLSKLDVLEQMEYLTKNAKDLGVKLDSIDATPPENTQSESELEASQSKELRQKVRAWT